MSPLPATEALLTVAQRVVWFKPATQALAEPIHFLAHVMTLGTAEDIAEARRAAPPDAFVEVLRAPPPGVFDPRSWAYWHLVLLRQTPPPPLPVRVLPA